MKLPNQRAWILGAISLAVIFLLTFCSAPSSKINGGSTFSRAPDGYGAWYAFMQQQGGGIQRWQRPLSDLAKLDEQKAKRPVTLLRVDPRLFNDWMDSDEQQWIEQGNTLIVLGVRRRVTPAAFSTLHTSSAGMVKIETTRRATQLGKDEQAQLSDQFGAIVWQHRMGKGKLILAVTPYLAANAYQNQSGNFKFLAELVAQAGGSLWVDEYIHGYKDTDVVEQEVGHDWSAYLAKTPLLPISIQLSVLLLVLLWAQNRRFGPRLNLTAPVTDNSEAYIQALAGVLQKAGSSEFILEVIGKEEQLQLQQALGLGPVPVDPRLLSAAWSQQTGRPVAELQQVLQRKAQRRRLSDSELSAWLGQLNALRQHLPRLLKK